MDNPLQLARSLKGAPLSVIFILTCVQMRVSQEFIERHSGYSDKPISQALSYLQDLQLIDHTSSGWALTGAARQLPLPGPALTIAETTPAVMIESESADVPAMKETTVVGENAESELFRLVSLDSLNLESKNLSDYLSRLGEIPTQKILSAAQQLFENRISGKAADYTNPVLMLAWIAQAYQGWTRNGGKIRNPERLVYYELHKGKETPEPEFMDDPLAFLPEWFAVELGVVEIEPDEPTGDIIEIDELPSAPETATLPSSDGELWWQATKDQLQMEMPLTSYKTWVRSLELERWEETANLFVIRAQSESQRAWCDGRLRRTITRLLTGMTGKQADVRFEAI